MRTRLLSVLSGIVLVTLLLSLAPIALAEPPQPGVTESVSLKASASSAPDALPPSVTRENEFLKVNAAQNGQFVIGTTGGDPATSSDNNKRLLFGFPSSIWSSFTTLRVVFGASTRDYRLGLDLQPSQKPYLAPNPDGTILIVTPYDVDGIHVEERLSFANNSDTGRKDTVAIEYVVTNQQVTLKSVGLRIMLDTMIGDNDGAPFFVEGKGRLTKEFEWQRDQMPAFWLAYESPTFDENSLKARGQLVGDGATTPDRFVAAYWPRSNSSVWDFTVNPNQVFAPPDSSALLYYNPKPLFSGRSQTYRTYYGMAKRGPLQSSIELIGLEVTQGIQNWRNSLYDASANSGQGSGIPLIQHKRTVVRAHVRSTSADIPNVTAELIGTRAAGGSTVQLGKVAARYVITVPIERNRSRDQLNDSFYFDVPDAWTTGTIGLEFRLTGERGAAVCKDKTGTANDCKASARFEPSLGPLVIRFVGIPYIEAGTAYTPTLWHANQAAWTIKELYPVPTLADQGGLRWSYVAGAQFASRPTLAQVNSRLSAMRAADNCGADCRTIYYGILVDPHGTLAEGGLAEGIPGWSGSGFFPESIDYGATRSGAPFTPFVPAHEIGHLLGNHHTQAGGCDDSKTEWYPNSPPSEWLYPYPAHSIGPANASQDDEFYGFGVVTKYIRPPALGGDLMGYCAPMWVSDWTYRHLLQEIWTRLTPPPEADAAKAATMSAAIIIRGSVNFTADTAKFGTFYELDADISTSEPVSSSYELRFLDANGSQLSSHKFEPNHPSDPDENGDWVGSFNLTLPRASSLARVELWHGDKLLATQTASPSKPTVQLVSPNGGETLNESSATFSWTSSDADADSLRYMLQFSPDSGQTWITLGVDLDASQAVISLNTLPQTTQGVARVLASDGFNTGQDRSDSVFSVKAHAPEVFIMNPIGGEVFATDQPVVLEGNGYDVEDGDLPDTAMSWTSSLDGALGTGQHLELQASGLSEGVHTITLTGRDSQGLVGTATVTIRVTRSIPTLAPDLSAAPALLRFFALVGGAVTDGQYISIRNNGGGELNWSASVSESWVRLTSASGDAPSNILVSADPAGMAQGVYTGTITITANALNSPQVVTAILTVRQPTVIDLNLDDASRCSFVSFAGAPYPNTDPRDLLADQLDSIDVVLGWDLARGGQVAFDPTLPDSINTLSSMDGLHGYWVCRKTDTSFAWRVLVDRYPANWPIGLNPGWNYASYLPEISEPPVCALASVTGSVKQVRGWKNGAMSYYPQLGAEFQTLNLMEPGLGYALSMTATATLQYPPACAGALVAGASTIQNFPAQATGVRLSSSWVDFYSEYATLDGRPLPVGSIVSAYSSDGIKVGETVVRYAGKVGVLAVYGDDPRTAEKDGARAGEAITFVVSGRPAQVMGPDASVWGIDGELRHVELSVTTASTSTPRVWLPVVGR